MNPRVKALCPGGVLRAITWLRWDLPWTVKHAAHALKSGLQERLGYDNWLGGLWVTLFRRFFRLDGCRFGIPRGLTSIRFNARFLFDSYERDGRILAREFLRPDDRVIELGACIGVLACVTNRLLNDECAASHVVVEANPYLAPELYRNRALNGSKFIAVVGAVSKAPSMEFYIHPLIVGGSADRKTGTRIRVPCFGLDYLGKQYGPFSAMLINIEGGECEVLKSFEDSWRACRLIVIEFHDFITGADAVRDLQALLSSGGFKRIKQLGSTEAWRKS